MKRQLKNSVIHIGKSISRGDNVNKSRFMKIAGKIVTYLAFVLTISGIVYTNPFYFLMGIIWIIIGCLMHEVNEK